MNVCKYGHDFEKTSSCTICPICSGKAMTKKFGEEFPKIGAPAFRALDTVGVRHIQDLTKFSKKELLSLHGFGPKALKLVIAELKVNGLSLVTK